MEKSAALIVTASLGAVKEMADQGVEMLTRLDTNREHPILKHLQQMRTLLKTAEDHVKRSAAISSGKPYACEDD